MLLPSSCLLTAQKSLYSCASATSENIFALKKMLQSNKASSYLTHQSRTSSTSQSLIDHYSSASIMAYEDDKSMTKRIRNVHVAVMHTCYTLARVAVLQKENTYHDRNHY